MSVYTHLQTHNWCTVNLESELHGRTNNLISVCSTELNPPEVYVDETVFRDAGQSLIVVLIHRTCKSRIQIDVALVQSRTQTITDAFILQPRLEFCRAHRVVYNTLKRFKMRRLLHCCRNNMPNHSVHCQFEYCNSTWLFGWDLMALSIRPYCHFYCAFQNYTLVKKFILAKMKIPHWQESPLCHLWIIEGQIPLS